MFEDFRAMIRTNTFVVLDTETSGLKAPAEIVQIAVVDFTGTVIYDSLVKPVGDIPADAYRVHGISTPMVAGAPAWPEVREQLLKLIGARHIVTYNAKFDRMMFHLSDEASGLPHTEYKMLNNWWCAMEWYAEFNGEFDDYHGNYRWIKLARACENEGVISIDEHSAVGDTLCTYALIRSVMHTLAKKDLFNLRPGYGAPYGDEDSSLTDPDSAI